MSNPFGTMPADRELAAFGSGFAGLLLGVLALDLLSPLLGGTAQSGLPPHRAWLLPTIFAATALVFAAKVTGLALRIALLAFATAQLVSIAAVASAIGIGPRTLLGIHLLVAGGVLSASWSYTGIRMRVATVVLFAAGFMFKLWVMSQTRSVWSEF
jgi:hypothetical protein